MKEQHACVYKCVWWQRVNIVCHSSGCHPPCFRDKGSLAQNLIICLGWLAGDAQRSLQHWITNVHHHSQFFMGSGESNLGPHTYPCNEKALYGVFKHLKPRFICKWVAVQSCLLVDLRLMPSLHATVSHENVIMELLLRLGLFEILLLRRLLERHIASGLRCTVQCHLVLQALCWKYFNCASARNTMSFSIVFFPLILLRVLCISESSHQKIQSADCPMKALISSKPNI